MFKVFFNNIFEQKFYLMILTTIIYILGLIGFFQECSVLVFGFLVFVFSVFLWKKYISPKLVFFWIFIFFFAFFNADLRIKNFDDLNLYAPQDAVITGQVLTIPDLGLERKTRFFVKVNEINSEKISAKTFVSLEGRHEEINIGDFYKITGKLRNPSTVTNPSQFDYSKYLRNYNTFTTFYAQSYNKIDKEISFKWKFLQNLNNKRKKILSYHAQNIKSPNIEILGGVVFGDDAVSPPDYIKKSFVNSGILHILAASGMNVALIYGIFFFILSKLKVPLRINNIIGILTIILYTFMTGMGASVIRASVILMFILIGKLMDREAHSIAMLAFVALLMLVINPAYINDVGFQLSFIVTFGLLVMTKPVFDMVKFIPNWLSSAIFIPIIAQLWVAPVQMFYFNSFCLYSVFANILILPLITIISFGGFISSVLAIITPIAKFECFVFDFLLNPVISGLVWVSDYFSNLSNSLITMPKPSLLQMFLYYALLLSLTLIISKRMYKKFFIPLILLLLISGLSFCKIGKGSEIIFFDVQNSDCFLYRTPMGKYFIIDTGKLGFDGKKSQVNYILMEYLKDEGIKDIEGLILTHFDADHSGGACDLLENFNINKLYLNSLDEHSSIADAIYKLDTHKVKAKNNQVIYEEKGLKIKTYIAEFEGKKYGNENSIITLIDDNGYKILLMGDAGVVAFNKLKKDLPIDIDVLKVGHHGGKNVVDKNMVEYLSPQYSVISTGINRYGHPDKTTLDILAETKILRTDKNNAIMFKNGKAFLYDKKKKWTEYK